MSKFIQNRDQRRVAGNADFGARDAEALRLCPALIEYLTVKRMEDGSSRQTSTATIFAEDGLWKVCLHDREASLSAWASGETVMGAIEALEASLQSGEAVWRRAGAYQKNGKK